MDANDKKRRREIDWQQARERIARAAAATQEAHRLSPEHAKAVMDERTQALARVPPEQPSAAEVLEVVRFALADEQYAIETKYVHEVFRLADFTPVPGAPDFLLGLTNLRGDILAVMELRKFFGVAERQLTDLSRVIVLGNGAAELGMLADAVHSVTLLRTEQVMDPPGSVAGVGREYLRGVTTDALIVLDAAVLLKDARLFIDQGEEDL